jgi:CheY-like chemotaxis protein
MRTNKPDLVLVDIIMQSVDGWQLIALKNADPGICNIPVIFVSAQDPSAVPIISPAMVVSIDEGLPTSKLLRCALAISATLLQPDAAPGPTPG